MSDTESLSTVVEGLTVRDQPIDLATWEIPHPRPFLCDIVIQPHQISRAIAHVSNIEYVKWLDRATELHGDALGYSRRVQLDANRMWFVARHEIDYLGEVWPEDRLILATWVRDVARVKSWRDYLVRRLDEHGEPEDVVCRASTLGVLVDLQRRKPVRIPDDMVQRLEPLTVRKHRGAMTPES